MHSCAGAPLGEGVWGAVEIVWTAVLGAERSHGGRVFADGVGGRAAAGGERCPVMLCADVKAYLAEDAGEVRCNKCLF